MHVCEFCGEPATHELELHLEFTPYEATAYSCDEHLAEMEDQESRYLAYTRELEEEA